MNKNCEGKSIYNESKIQNSKFPLKRIFKLNSQGNTFRHESQNQDQHQMEDDKIFES